MGKNYIFGYHAVKTLLNSTNKEILTLWCQNGRHEELINLANKAKILVKVVSKIELDQLAPRKNHQGILAEILTMRVGEEKELKEFVLENTLNLKLLILDGIEDPHNLGACIRTACALGINGVIFPKNKACGITATVSKVASGAIREIPLFQVVNLARILDYLKKNDFWIYGASEHGKTSLNQITFNQPWGIVFGKEGTGIRPLTANKCDDIFRIPMHHPLINSLNVSVAVGISLFTALHPKKL